MERLKQRLQTARKALSSFKEALHASSPTSIERDGAIQRFEYTTEALWKAAQLYLEIVEGISEGSPKGAIRRSREVGLLTEELTTTALEMMDDRNLTVHTYDEDLAEKIYSHLRDYAHLFEIWLAQIEKRLSSTK